MDRRDCYQEMRQKKEKENITIVGNDTFMNDSKDGYKDETITNHRLNPAAEGFCRGIALGLDGAEALRQAGDYDGTSDATLRQKAYRWRKRPEIRARIREIQDEMLREAIRTAGVTRDDLIHDLDRIRKAALDALVGPDGKLSKANADIALKAIEQTSRMCGFDAPQQVDNTISVVMDGEDVDEYAQ